MATMLETLLEILSWGLASPEILREEDGCLGLDYAEYDCSVSIHPDGRVSWAIMAPEANGTDIVDLRRRLDAVAATKGAVP